MLNSHSKNHFLKNRKAYLAIIAVGIVCLVIGGFLFFNSLFRAEKPWLFNGAFATYRGEVSSPLASMSMTMRMEVVDHNITHAKLLVFQKVEMNVGNSAAGLESFHSPVENQWTSWIDLSNNNYVLTIEQVPARTSEEHVYVEGLGTRYCTIYNYDQGGATFTVYVDRENGWILKMKWAPIDRASSSLGLTTIELNIEETNISGLK